MVDGGSSSVKQLAAYRLEPYLRSQGVNRLDYVLVSHTDGDHTSGLMELLAAGWPLGSLILSPQSAQDEAGKALVALAEEKGTKIILLAEGQTIHDGKVTLRCLHPDGGAYYADPNDACLVIKLAYKDFSLLLTGDVDQKTEEGLLGRLDVVSVLKVAHHGSKNSSGEAFLDKVKPQAAVASSSRNNLYGHPHPDTLARLDGAGAQVYLTKDRGAVMLSTNGKRFRIHCFID